MELISTWPLLWLSGAAGLWLLLRYSLVDRPRALLFTSLGLRTIGVILLAVALCRPYLRTSTDELHVAFLVDVSQSVEPEQARAAVADVETAIGQLRAGDTWSLFSFARELRPYEAPQALAEALETLAEEAGAEQFRSATNLGAALSAARLALPAGKAQRVVVFSDGRPTDGSTRETVALLQRENVDIRYRPLRGLVAPEVALAQLAPALPTAFEHEVVRFTARVASNTDTTAQVRLTHSGIIIAEQSARLAADETTAVTFDVPMEVPGVTVWTAEVAAAADRYTVNNQGSCVVTVRGDSRVLVLHNETRKLRPFARALQQQGFALDIRQPRGLPRDLKGMLEFDAVILADAPATAFTTTQMQLLRRYVTDFGGGLLMMGSENSFGLGGYYKTPVEAVLPLLSRFEKEREKPSLAMVLVIDKSGSMEGMPITLARQAARATVELLGARDQIGVTAFDSAPYVVVEMRPGSDAQAVKAAIDRLGAGGGTFMYSGMVAARDLLAGATAKVKHMIVLSDGQTQPADHAGLVSELVDMGVTVSTVALGAGADRGLLAHLAELGRGRYYETLDPQSVPQIFTRETMHASRSAIKEDLFTPVIVNDHPVLAGFQQAAWPFVLGCVMTQPRPTAQVVLATDAGDPLLALSRFGLGIGMAYTSDMTEAWGGEWLAWPDCGRFWSQVLRFVSRKVESDGIFATARVEGETWCIDVRAQDEQRQPLSNLAWDAQLFGAGGGGEPVEVRPVGLGRYRVEVPLQGRPRLSLRLYAPEAERLRVLHYERDYPAEYRLQRQRDAALQALPSWAAERTREDIRPTSTRRALTPTLVLSAIAALLGSVLLRRL